MTLLRLRYVHRFKDRHGHVRHYLRLPPGRKRIPLPGKPGSPEFMAAYQAAIAAPPSAEPVAVKRTIPGSIDALAIEWYASAQFRALGPVTQGTYRRIVERLRAEHGHRIVAEMEPQHVRRLVAARAEQPTAANHLLRILRFLLRFAVEEGWRPDDPSRDVRRVRHRSTGYHTWTEDEIAAFEERWPIGTRPRLALALLLYTAQRRSDVVRMGRQHLRGSRVEVRQVKTGATLLIPMHSDLRRAIDAVPKDQLTFLMTEAGKPFTANGFYMRFAEWAAEAGLPKGCSPHGLRKAAARRLAEAGCTAHQIAAITGHRTLAEVERYTRAANQILMADAAIKRIGGGDEP